MATKYSADISEPAWNFLYQSYPDAKHDASVTAQKQQGFNYYQCII